MQLNALICQQICLSEIGSLERQSREAVFPLWKECELFDASLFIIKMIFSAKLMLFKAL